MRCLFSIAETPRVRLKADVLRTTEQQEVCFIIQRHRWQDTRKRPTMLDQLKHKRQAEEQGSTQRTLSSGRPLYPDPKFYVMCVMVCLICVVVFQGSYSRQEPLEFSTVTFGISSTSIFLGKSFECRTRRNQRAWGKHTHIETHNVKNRKRMSKCKEHFMLKEHCCYKGITEFLREAIFYSSLRQKLKQGLSW